MTAPVQIDLSDEPADIGVGYGLPPWDDPDNFVLRVGEVRLLLSDAQIERLLREQIAAKMGAVEAAKEHLEIATSARQNNDRRADGPARIVNRVVGGAR